MSNASVSKVPGNAVPIFHVEVYHIRCVMVQFDGYPFSNNHGSVENDPLIERKRILEIHPFSMIMGGRVYQIHQVCQLDNLIQLIYVKVLVFDGLNIIHPVAHCRLKQPARENLVKNASLQFRNKQRHTFTNHMRMAYRHVHKKPTKSLTQRESYQHIVSNTDSTQMMVHSMHT